SLFSTFSDSMLQYQQWSESRQINVISGLAKQITRTYPGILVFNLHPQNVSSVRNVHRAVVDIGRRPGWRALGAESLRRWLEVVAGVRLSERAGSLVLSSPQPVAELALRWAHANGPTLLPPWQGEHVIADR